MEKGYKIKIENGYYIFKLEQLLKEKGISKNMLMKATNTDFKVLQRLIKAETVRIDITVLARLCDYFNCKITDIIEYVPNKK